MSFGQAIFQVMSVRSRFSQTLMANFDEEMRLSYVIPDVFSRDPSATFLDARLKDFGHDTRGCVFKSLTLAKLPLVLV